MLEGSGHLRESAALLAGVGDGDPPRDVLAKAVREVWLASGGATAWPEEMGSLAAELLALCFRDGGIDDTVRGLSGAEAREVVSSIRRLAEEAERFGGE